MSLNFFKFGSKTKAKTKFGGKLIHSCRDEFGLIQVVETTDTRSLHFDSSVQQSQIFLHAPMTLAFNYQQQLETLVLNATNQAWLQGKQLENILMLGVGGGTLASKLFLSLPKTNFTLVDLREKVLQVAHDFFYLPIDSRINTEVADASEFLQQSYGAQPAKFEVIIVDIYNEFGLPSFVTKNEFLNQLINAQPGLVLINLWQSDPKSCLKIIEFFKQQPGELELFPIEPSKNLILSYSIV